MLNSILLRTVLIVAICLLTGVPAQPVVAEEFDIVFLAKPSGKYKQPATIALVGGGYTNGLVEGMIGTSYRVLDVGGIGFPALEMNEVVVHDVTAFASSCLIQGVKLEEIASDCVVSFELPVLNAHDYRRKAGEAFAAGDYERSEAFLEKLIRTDSLSPDSSVYQLLDSCRAITDSEFSRKLSRKERKLEKKRAPIYHRLGTFFFSNNDYDAARYYLERTVRGDDTREHAKSLLCIIEDGLPCEVSDTSEAAPLEVYPKMIYQHRVDYPRLARQAGVTGSVWVTALVDKSGLVLKTKVGKSSGWMALDQAATNAAYYNRFQPGIQKGKPVACWVTYKVVFILD